jgi:hypothetical protein
LFGAGSSKVRRREWSEAAAQHIIDQVARRRPERLERCERVFELPQSLVEQVTSAQCDSMEPKRELDEAGKALSAELVLPGKDLGAYFRRLHACGAENRRKNCACGPGRATRAEKQPKMSPPVPAILCKHGQADVFCSLDEPKSIVT